MGGHLRPVRGRWSDLERFMGGLTPRWGQLGWSEAQALSAILERRARDARSHTWLRRWAMIGPGCMESVIADDQIYGSGALGALILETGRGEWYAGAHHRDRDADNSQGSATHRRAGDLAGGVVGHGPACSPLVGSGSGTVRDAAQLHPGSSSDPETGHDPGPVAADDHRPPCTCLLRTPPTAPALELLRTIARCRALVAWYSDLRADYLTDGSDWVAFESALRRSGTGRLLKNPRCGLCGGCPVGDRRDWLIAHPLAGAHRAT